MKKTATQFGKLAANSDAVDYRSLATGLGGLTVGSMPALSAAEIIKNVPNIYSKTTNIVDPYDKKILQSFADKIKPGSVLLFNEPDKALNANTLFKALHQKADNLGTINPMYAHATQVYRAPDGSLVTELPSGGLVDGANKAMRSRSVTLQLLLSKLKKRQLNIQKPSALLNPIAALKGDLATVKKIMAMSAKAKQRLSPEAVSRGLSSSVGLTDFLRYALNNDHTITVMDPVKNLSESDLLKKLQTVGATSFSNTDMTETGLRRMLFPKSLAGLFGGKTPSSCSGGICSITGGGSPTGTLPYDIANSKAYKHLMTLSSKKSLIPKSKQLADVLRAAGVRGLLAAPFLGLGAYHLSKSMPSK